MLRADFKRDMKEEKNVTYAHVKYSDPERRFKEHSAQIWYNVTLDKNIEERMLGLEQGDGFVHKLANSEYIKNKVFSLGYEIKVKRQEDESPVDVVSGEHKLVPFFEGWRNFDVDHMTL